MRCLGATWCGVCGSLAQGSGTAGEGSAEWVPGLRGSGSWSAYLHPMRAIAPNGGITGNRPKPLSYQRILGIAGITPNRAM